jgi:hypothetical protein
MIHLSRVDAVVVRNHLSVLNQHKVPNINLWPFGVEVEVKDLHYMVAGFVSAKFKELRLICESLEVDVDKKINLVWQRGKGKLLFPKTRDNSLHWFNLESLKLAHWVEHKQTVEDRPYLTGRFELYFEEFFANPKVLFDRKTRAFRKERVSKKKLSEIEFEVEQGNAE